MQQVMPAVEALSAEQQSAIARAQERPASYGFRFLTAPDGCVLVVVGEAHAKLRRAKEIGQELIRAFDLRGVETFPVRRVALGRLLKALTEGPRLLLRALSLGAVKDSSIADARAAKTGKTFMLESVSAMPMSLQVATVHLSAIFIMVFVTLAASPFLQRMPPRIAWQLYDAAIYFQWHFVALIPAFVLRRFSWSWILFPALAILTVRNSTMAEGTVTMLRENPHARSALIIMGRGHLPGYQRVLVEDYGFAICRRD